MQPVSPLCTLPHTETPPPRSEESALYRGPMRDSLWQGVLTEMKRDVARAGTAEMQSLVQSIADGIRWLDSTMDRYCSDTCPSCEDPCCTGLEVFYNRADMLYLVSLGEEVPPGQTRTMENEPCRYLTDGGCALPRTVRPYVCVWFICEAQMEVFQAEPAGFQRRFIRAMQDIRAYRLRIESLYELTFRPPPPSASR